MSRLIKNLKELYKCRVLIQNLIGRTIPEGEIPAGVLTHTSLAPALRPAKAGIGGGRRGPRRYV